jgi:hypothetical protein
MLCSRRGDTWDALCPNHQSVSWEGLPQKLYWGVVPDHTTAPEVSCSGAVVWSFCMSSSFKLPIISRFSSGFSAWRQLTSGLRSPTETDEAAGSITRWRFVWFSSNFVHLPRRETLEKRVCHAPHFLHFFNDVTTKGQTGESTVLHNHLF